MQIILNGDITQENIKRAISSLVGLPRGEPVEILLCSDGGEILQAQSLISILRNYETTCYITGNAFSAGAIIALSCNHVFALRDSTMLIHSCYGAGDFTKDINNIMASLVANRCDITQYLDGYDYLFNCQQMLDLGFIDGIIDTVDLEDNAIVAKGKIKMPRKKITNKVVAEEKEIQENVNSACENDEEKEEVKAEENVEEEEVKEEEVKEEVKAEETVEEEVKEEVEEISNELNSLKELVSELLSRVQELENKLATEEAAKAKFKSEMKEAVVNAAKVSTGNKSNKHVITANSIFSKKV